MRGKDPGVRIVRFKETMPNWQVWQDAKEPGHFRALYRLISAAAGGGAEATAKAGPFSVGIVLCPPGNGTAPHAHGADEVYLPLSGEWEVFWGENNEGRVRLDPWDCIAVAPGVMRGFRNVGTDDAYILAVIVGEPGAARWGAG